MITTNLGYPRIGASRELKRAVEGYWQGNTGREDLLAVARELQINHWRRQAAAGIDLIPTYDFALYDHVLDHVAMFGMIPPRFGWQGGEVDLDTLFAMARGTDSAPAMDLTKWFNTNYHYISAELGGEFTLTANRPLEAWQLAQSTLELNTKPVLVGPYTFLKLANNPDEIPLETLLDRLLPLYRRVLADLQAAGVTWVQLDEPWLVTDVSADELALVAAAYAEIARGPTPQVMLQTYFDDIAAHWSHIVSLPVAGLGLDFVHGPENLGTLEAHSFPTDKTLGIGLVNGRNVWRTDLDAALDILERIGRVVDLGQAHLGPSCSLLHVPVTTALEHELDPTIKCWLAFADERLAEVGVLGRAVEEGRPAVADELTESRSLRDGRRLDPRVTDPTVAQRLAALSDADYERDTPDSERQALQAARLQLPPLPTTTIGSFPQTRDVRQARSRFKRGELSEADYRLFLESQFRHVIDLQHELGLDVLAHGEFERSDMVDFFAEQLTGMAFIEGWVQSFGTRCVRPPLIYGDVSRPRPMTVDVARTVQAMTDRPLKGMLTGPVTMVMWSFPRDDIPRELVATQLALAIRDEVLDLEAAGIAVIQIDEPAFREGLPLQRSDWQPYLLWAARAFRLAAGGAGAATQVHTHMCYSEFNDYLPAIHHMGADVISIENSRSAGELLTAFREFDYDRGIGPGVYDVHSTRIPSVEEIAAQLRRSAAALHADRLWVNPDCGLKTRAYKEVVPALRNMVAAARQVRAELFGADAPDPGSGAEAS